MGILNVDLVVFVSLVFVYNKIKQTRPEMLFLSEGVAVFLPPDEKEHKELVNSQVKNSKKGGKKPLMPMKVMKPKSEFFSKYPFAVECDIAVMLLVCFAIQLVVSEVIRRVVCIFMPEFSEKDMSITFSIGLSVFLLLMAYYCKSVKMAGWKSSETKMAFLISVVSSLLVLTLIFGFKEVVNFDFLKAVDLQQKHLTYVLSATSATEMFFSLEVFQLGCVFLNAIATFSVVPSITRFANCYATNLRKTIESKVRSQDMAERAAQSKKSDNPFLIDENEQEDNLAVMVEKQTNTEVARHQKNMMLFNVSLVLHLISIVLWIQPIVKIISSQFGESVVETYLPLVRLAIIIVQCLLQLASVRYQIQMFLLKSYELLKTLANDSNETTFKIVKYKTSAYVQSCMHAGFQILTSSVLPLIIAVLILYRCYLSPSKSLPENSTQTPVDANDSIEFFKALFNNIKIYSIFNNKFIELTLSFWLFNYQVITYILKIVFIIITRQSNGV